MIECFVCGPYQTNVYCWKSEKLHHAVVIDAAPGSFDQLKDGLAGYKIHLFLTHGHWDHIADAAKFQQTLGSIVYLHEADQVWLNLDLQRKIMPRNHTVNFEIVNPDKLLKGEESLLIGPWELKILHLPGHTKGSIGVYSLKQNVFFSGDTLFKSSVGRTDLYGGSYKSLRTSLKQIFQSFPGQMTIYPGHGEITNIDVERRFDEAINNQNLPAENQNKIIKIGIYIPQLHSTLPGIQVNANGDVAYLYECFSRKHVPVSFYFKREKLIPGTIFEDYGITSGSMIKACTLSLREIAQIEDNRWNKMEFNVEKWRDYRRKFEDQPPSDSCTSSNFGETRIPKVPSIGVDPLPICWELAPEFQ